MENLEEKIETKRIKKGVSRMRMCKELGISTPTLYRMYRSNGGKTETIEKIFKYLDINEAIEAKQPLQKNDMINKAVEVELDFLRNKVKYLEESVRMLKPYAPAEIRSFYKGGLLGVLGFC